MHSRFDDIVSDAYCLGVTSSINVTKNVAVSSTLGCFCFVTRYCRMYILTRWRVREFWTMLSRDLKPRNTGSCLLAANVTCVCLFVVKRQSVSAETEMSRKLLWRGVLSICHSSLVWRGSLLTGFGCCDMLGSPVPFNAVKLVIGWTLDRLSCFPVYMTTNLFWFNYLGDDESKWIKTMIQNFFLKHQTILVAVVKWH